MIITEMAQPSHAAAEPQSGAQPLVATKRNTYRADLLQEPEKDSHHHVHQDLQFEDVAKRLVAVRHNFRIAQLVCKHSLHRAAALGVILASVDMAFYLGLSLYNLSCGRYPLQCFGERPCLHIRSMPGHCQIEERR